MLNTAKRGGKHVENREKMGGKRKEFSLGDVWSIYRYFNVVSIVTLDVFQPISLSSLADMLIIIMVFLIYFLNHAKREIFIEYDQRYNFYML